MRTGVSLCKHLLLALCFFLRMNFVCQISDMVSIARMMNATLVIPQLDKRSFWQDSRYSSSTLVWQNRLTSWVCILCI